MLKFEVMAPVLETAIANFFKKKENYDKLKQINENKNIQPRLIDYFVTQYSKLSPQFFIPEINGKGYGLMDVYSSYKLQLKGYHKKSFNLFDKKKLLRVGPPPSVIEMPISKLNVFRWMIDNGIYEIIETNLKTLQGAYYDFRKSTIKIKGSHKDRSKKRGKMNTFIKSPLIIKGLNNITKKNCHAGTNEY